MDRMHNGDDENLVAVLESSLDVAVLFDPRVKDFTSEWMETVLASAICFATH
jgi:hypothetical protein